MGRENQTQIEERGVPEIMHFRIFRELIEPMQDGTGGVSHKCETGDNAICSLRALLPASYEELTVQDICRRKKL